jgi:DNA-binding CsgD family transcriptional regulator
MSAIANCIPMNRSEFEDSYEKLTPRQKEVLKLFLTGKSDREIAEDSHYKPASIRFHIANVEKVFELSENSGERCRVELIELFIDYKPELVAQPLRDRYRLDRPTPDIPGRPMALNSAFYIPPACEDRCEEEVLKPGQLIRIGSPHKMGKTSLLNRILDIAKDEEYYTIACNCRSDLDRSDLDSSERFFGCFFQTIAEKLQLEADNFPTKKRDCTTCKIGFWRN